MPPKRSSAARPSPGNGAVPWRPWAVVLVGLGGVLAVVLLANRRTLAPAGVPASPVALPTATGATAVATSSVSAAPVLAAEPPVAGWKPAPRDSGAALSAATNAVPVMEINKAVMVTVQLDFGPVVPSVEQALLQIERRHQPDDGRGRTFAILDAYGGPTPDGKKLHLSMHLSSEKPGLGQLVFTRTGEVLWQSRIVQGTNTSTFTGKNLLILIDNGAGRTFTVDGSRNPRTILEATIKELNLPMTEFWPDGAERELIFIYSACGCPVKVMCRRVGDRTVRTKDLPVIFPDDPPVVALLNQLMRW